MIFLAEYAIVEMRYFVDMAVVSNLYLYTHSPEIFPNELDIKVYFFIQRNIS